MNKSFRIKTEIGTNADKHLKVKLNKDVDTLNILSLSIDQRDLYQSFNCDYGVIVGRVLANGGVGIPNAKLSIFIPITEDDSLRPEIRALYPYESPRDQNADGKRYNLLTRVAKTQLDGTVRPKQPFGSFPTKEEFLTNDDWLEVYDTYYKFSTVTNDSGDFMLFGVPVGIQTVHMSVDVTDIGRFSMTPQTLITNLGYSPNLFTDNGSRIKESTDLNDLPNIETQEISVDVIPFCGDSENFNIGITRQDFRIRAELVNNFVVFGSAFTMSQRARWNDLPDGGEFDDLFLLAPRFEEFPNSTSPVSFRNGRVDERILYLPPSITDTDAAAYNFDPESDLLLLAREEYTRVVNPGEYLFILPCNRKKIITGENGEDVEVEPDSPIGVFTEFYGVILYDIPLTDQPVDSFTKEGLTDERTYRVKFRAPQAFHSNRYDGDLTPKEYLGKYKVFKASNFYTTSQFVHTEYVGAQNFNTGNAILDRYTNVIVNPEEAELDPTGNVFFGFGFNENFSIFAGEWLNMALYFSQFATLRDTSGGANPDTNDVVPYSFFRDNNENFLPFYRPESNTQPIGAGLVNSQGYIRADRHYIDFTEVPRGDIVKISQLNSQGFRYSDINNSENTIRQSNIPVKISNDINDLANGPGASLNEIGFDFDESRYPVNTNTDPYFLKGLNNANVIQLLIDNNLI